MILKFYFEYGRKINDHKGITMKNRVLAVSLGVLFELKLSRMR